MFTNFLLLHNKRVEDMILDMKDNIQVVKLKIGKQKVQYNNITKLGCMIYLVG